jgi:hypothetical protein
MFQELSLVIENLGIVGHIERSETNRNVHPSQRVVTQTSVL